MLTICLAVNFHMLSLNCQGQENPGFTPFSHRSLAVCKHIRGKSIESDWEMASWQRPIMFCRKARVSRCLATSRTISSATSIASNESRLLRRQFVLFYCSVRAWVEMTFTISKLSWFYYHIHFLLRVCWFDSHAPQCIPRGRDCYLFLLERSLGWLMLLLLLPKK